MNYYLPITLSNSKKSVIKSVGRFMIPVRREVDRTLKF